MFEISAKKVDFEKQNTIIKRNISLDKDLDCFILISSKDTNFSENLLNNSLEYLIDKISKENTYNDFSIALEGINSFIKTWTQEEEKDFNLKMTIGVLNGNSYVFSNLGKSSLYLINRNSEVIELTSKTENSKDFSYVSSGELRNGEIVISSTVRLLNYLSNSDLIDGLVLSEDIKIFNKNIKNILLSEILDENILVSSLKYASNDNIENGIDKLDFVKEYLFKIFDNKFSKQIIAYFLVLKEKILSQSKMVKNILFLGGIILAIIFLFSTLSTIISATTQNQKALDAEAEKIKIKNYVTLASENIANIETFEKNINNAEVLIKKLEEEKIFLDDLEKLTENINILKKQFNKIETFSLNTDNLIYSSEIENPVKIIKNKLKPYIITKKSVIGAILPNSKPKTYIFNDLSSEENFVDATFVGDNILLLTSESKVVKFTKNGYFCFVDVIGQKTWEKAKSIKSYGQNIYLVGSDENQINKHTAYGTKFKSAIGYLNDGDKTQVGNILSIAIDGGFYILKEDLSVVKFYSNPYRMENIVLNKLPKNYDKLEGTKIDLKTRKDLNYVYLLMNNKIWLFKPNTKNFQNTKSLTYIGQIDGGNNKVEDFFINYDGEILILNGKGLYKLKFEISDDKIILR